MDPNDDNTQTTGTTSQTTGQTTPSSDDDDARLADFRVQLERARGDATRLAEKYHERNYKYRQEIQELRAQLEKMQGKVPADPKEIDLLKQYKALGTPQEIGERQNKLTKLQRYQSVTEAARVAGVNPKVLSTLLPSDAELKTGEARDQDGNAKQIVLVAVGDEETPLDKYAESNWSDFLPALRASNQQEDQNQGARWIPQQSSRVGDANSSGVNPILKAKLDEARKRATPAT